MYGFDNETSVSEGTAVLQPGINENVFLSSVKFESMSEGRDPVLQIEFKTKEGATLREVAWPVDPEKVRHEDGKTHKRDIPALGFVKGAPVTRQDTIKREFDNFNVRLKHIATKFVSDEEAIINAKSYEDFASQYVALLNKPEYQAIPLRLKVVLNTKDYSTLPKYPPFVELMEDATKLRIGQYDKVVPTTAAASPAPVDTPVSFDFGADEATF